MIRLWEQPKEIFFQLPGLLPFAVLSNTNNPYEVLKQVATELDKIEERRDRSNLTAASQILAGLVLDEYTISEIPEEGYYERVSHLSSNSPRRRTDWRSTR